MPKVCCRYNYVHIVLSSDLKFPTKALCGHSLPVLMRDGTYKNHSFGGFVSADFGQRVKIQDVVSYTEGDGTRDWKDLPPAMVLLGQYLRQ